MFRGSFMFTFPAAALVHAELRGGLPFCTGSIQRAV
jgi:hypothetical protein